jgi:hypothetical protein
MSRRSSRNWMESVMAHQGFGELIIIKNGAKVTVPQTQLYSTGTVKKKIRARLECLTAESIKDLESEGVRCELNIMSQAK